MDTFGYPKTTMEYGSRQLIFLVYLNFDDRLGRTRIDARAAAHAQFLIDDRDIVRHIDRFLRAFVDTGAATAARLFIYFHGHVVAPSIRSRRVKRLANLI